MKDTSRIQEILSLLSVSTNAPHKMKGRIFENTRIIVDMTFDK